MRPKFRSWCVDRSRLDFHENLASYDGEARETCWNGLRGVFTSRRVRTTLLRCTWTCSPITIIRQCMSGTRAATRGIREKSHGVYHVRSDFVICGMQRHACEPFFFRVHDLREQTHPTTVLSCSIFVSRRGVNQRRSNKAQRGTSGKHGTDPQQGSVNGNSKATLCMSACPSFSVGANLPNSHQRTKPPDSTGSKQNLRQAPRISQKKDAPYCTMILTTSVALGTVTLPGRDFQS